MNKRKKIIKQISSLIIFIVCLLVAIYFAYYSQDGYTKDMIIEPLHSYSKNIYTDNMNNQNLPLIEEKLSILPDSVEEEIENEWIICFTDKFYSKAIHNKIMDDKLEEKDIQFDSTTTSVDIAGLTLIRPRVIYLNTKYDEEEITKTIYHEIGHVISYKNGSAHNSLEIKKLYNKYKDELNILDDYEKADVTEWFAGLFKEYILRPDELKNNYPELYNYMDNIVQENGEKDIVSNFKKAIIGSTRNIIALFNNRE